MQYAKISSANVVLIFPYTLETLEQENPNTSFDSRFSLADWYAQTEDALLNQNVLAEVKAYEPPTVDFSMQTLIRAADPVFANGTWVLEWLVENKTPSEVVDYQALLDTPSAQS